MEEEIGYEKSAMRWNVIALLSALSVSACGGGVKSGATATQEAGAPQDGGTDAGPPTSGDDSSTDGSSDAGEAVATFSPGVSLIVDGTSEPSTVNGASPSQFGFFYVVEFTLANNGASTPLSTDPSLFSVATGGASAALAYAYVGATSQCGAAVSVATGQQVECTLAFQVATTQRPITLLYNDGHGDTASVPLPPIPKTNPAPGTDAGAAACEAVSSWATESSSAACLTCLKDEEGPTDAGLGKCASTYKSWTNTCGSCGTCSETDPCSCQASCGATCPTLLQAFSTCLYSACYTACE